MGTPLLSSPVFNPANLKGGIAGIGAALATGYLAKFGAVAAMAAFVGLPEAEVTAVIAGILVTGLNSVVTHVAEKYPSVGQLNFWVTSLSGKVPQLYAEFPTGKNGQTATVASTAPPDAPVAATVVVEPKSDYPTGRNGA